MCTLYKIMCGYLFIFMLPCFSLHVALNSDYFCSYVQCTSCTVYMYVLFDSESIIVCLVLFSCLLLCCFVVVYYMYMYIYMYMYVSLQSLAEPDSGQLSLCHQ